jgi:hypothetical protein
MTDVQLVGIAGTVFICTVMLVFAIALSAHDIVKAIDRSTDSMSDCLDEPAEPLGEAVEWETEDGLMRTTDKKTAISWSSHFTMRVVRRAPIKETTP